MCDATTRIQIYNQPILITYTVIINTTSGR